MFPNVISRKIKLKLWRKIVELLNYSLGEQKVSQFDKYISLACCYFRGMAFLTDCNLFIVYFRS